MGALAPSRSSIHVIRLCPPPTSPSAPHSPWAGHGKLQNSWGAVAGKANSLLLHVFSKTALLVEKALHLKKNLIVRLRSAINVWLFLSAWGRRPMAP